MRNPEGNLALYAEREFAEFAVVKAVMVSDEHELGILDIGAQVERGVLGSKPFRDFGVCKEEHVLDAFFVNRVERKVQRRDNGIVCKREAHDLEAVFVEDRRLAGIVAQVVDGHLLCHATDRLYRLGVRAATQVEGSIEIEYYSFYRGFHANQYSIFFIFRRMKTPDSRFYCPLITVGNITLDENESTHAVRVCRACVGDVLQLSDGVGHFADAIIEVANAKACVVRVDSVIEAERPRPKVSLGIACLKDDALEEVVFHAAQTEIDKIIFLRTDFSQEPKNSDLKKTVRRAELKSLVSLKQSKKAWMTNIEGPVEFDKWLEGYNGDLILCDIDGERQLDLSGSGANENATPITLLVGPEGGFSPREIEAIKTFRNGKVHLLNLGNTRLRARTAAIIALGKIL